MTLNEAKTIFLNRGYVETDGGSYFDGNKWRESVVVISEWLKEEPCSDALDKIRIEIRKKMKFNSFNEGYVLYDDITGVLDKYKVENEPQEREDKCSNCAKSWADDCPRDKCWNNDYSEFIEESEG